MAEALSGEAQGVRTSKTSVDTTPTAPDALTTIYGAMREAELQRSIRTYLKEHGFTVWVFPIMKRTIAGVPDLTFWHADRPGLLWYWELKRSKGKIRPEQQSALDHLATVPGVDARIVRPEDWPALRDELERVPPSEQGREDGDE